MARGLAHIGVLKVLDQNKIPIHYIAGASSGAIVGAAFASGMEVRLIEEIALRISWGRILKVAFFRPGFVSGEAIEEMVVKYIGDKIFSELKIPLAVMATDIKSGEPVAIYRGRVARAVMASSAIPGLVVPAEINQRFLMDGGFGNNLPVDVAKRMGANYTIAVDVIPSKPIRNLPKNPLRMYERAFDIVMHKLSKEQRKKANILIEPQIEEDIWQLDLHKAKRLIFAGEAAANRMIGKIRRQVKL